MKLKFLLLNFILIIVSFTSDLYKPVKTNSLNNKYSTLIENNYIKNLPKNDYILGPGDILNITLSDLLPELNQEEVIIDGEGTVNLPFLNRIFIEGLSLEELKKLLDSEYIRFIKDPQVKIRVVDYRPIKVLLKGELVNPGMQTLKGFYSLEPLGVISNSMPAAFPTVFDAIRVSGGITNYSDLSNVKLIRVNNLSNGGGKIETELNFANMLQGGEINQNIRIFDRDIIEIKKLDEPNEINIYDSISTSLSPKFIEVFITGRVNRPGKLKISRATVLTDALDVAGGTKTIKGPIRFIRVNNNGTLDKRVFALRKRAKRGSYKNPNLRDGDLIVVGNSVFNQTTEIINEVTSPFSGIFSTYALIKAFTD